MSSGSRGQNLDNLASSIEGIQEHTHTYTKTHECRDRTAVRMYVCMYVGLWSWTDLKLTYWRYFIWNQIDLMATAMAV